MNIHRIFGQGKSGIGCKPDKKSLFGLIIFITLFILISGAGPVMAQWPEMAFSNDGTPISYEIFGQGEQTLIFVHGWSCDARYWRAQVPVFSKKYRVIVLDLAGHGHSGMSRSRYTMRSFGEDVRAVAEATDSRNIILIGHSMGGSVIAEAASLMPDRVIGLIGVDTLENIEYKMTKEEYQQMTAPLEADFKNGTRQFVSRMISSETDPKLREWILDDMSSAPPGVALSAMKEMMDQYVTGEAAKIFERIKIPVITVKGDLWPVNFEANRRHMFSFDAIVLKGADHFLMMDHSEPFNAALGKALSTLVR